MLKTSGLLYTDDRQDEMKQAEVYKSHSKFMKSKVERLRELAATLHDWSDELFFPMTSMTSTSRTFCVHVACPHCMLPGNPAHICSDPYANTNCMLHCGCVSWHVGYVQAQKKNTYASTSSAAWISNPVNVFLMFPPPVFRETFCAPMIQFKRFNGFSRFSFISIHILVCPAVFEMLCGPSEQTRAASRYSAPCLFTVLPLAVRKSFIRPRLRFL